MKRVLIATILLALLCGCSEHRTVNVTVNDDECRDALEFRWYVKKNYPLIWQEYYGGTAIGN